MKNQQFKKSPFPAGTTLKINHYKISGRSSKSEFRNSISFLIDSCNIFTVGGFLDNLNKNTTNNETTFLFSDRGYGFSPDRV